MAERNHRRLHCIALVLPWILILCWQVSLSSSALVLHVATEDLVAEATGAAAASTTGESAGKLKQQPQRPLSINKTNSTSSQHVNSNNITNATGESLLSDQTSDTSLPVTNSNHNNTTTTTTNHRKFRREAFSSWQLPPAWTAPLNDSSSEEEMVYHYDDDKTYLDIFGEVTKEFLTQQVILHTDAECDWNWKKFRCEPYCHCGFQPILGDYHLGRSCRRRGHTLPTRALPSNASTESSSSSTAASLTPPPALSPCEYDGDVPIPLLLAQQLVQKRLQQAEPVVKSAVHWWQQKWQELLQSPQRIKAQRTIILWLTIAQYKLLALQSKACTNLVCPLNETDGTATTPLAATSDTSTTEQRPPGPWVLSQRYLCRKLRVAAKCDSRRSSNATNSSGQENSTQPMFPWPPDKEYVVDARPQASSHPTQKPTSPPAKTTSSSRKGAEQPSTKRLFREWTKNR